MKHFLFFYLFLFMAGLSAHAQSNLVVEINDTNFPDDNFRADVANYDSDTDGWLSEEEIANVTEIQYGFGGVPANMEGIRYFTSMETLLLNNNNYTLTTLDVHDLPALKYLVLGALPALESVNASGCTALVFVRAQYEMGSLCHVNFSNCPSLQELTLNETAFTAFDASEYESLQILRMHKNAQLSSLTIKNNHNLTFLECSYSPIASLDLSGNTELISLSFGANQLTSLDLSNNTKLTSLSCEGNQLTSLDLSNNTKLTSLYCEGNQLTSLDLSGLPKLKEVYCQDNRLSTLCLYNDMENSVLWRLSCSNNCLSEGMIDGIISCLPNSGGELEILDKTKDTERNAFTALQGVIASSKGWKVNDKTKSDLSNFYLYNPASGLYLCAATSNDVGTPASLGEQGLKVELTWQDDDTYTIDTHIYAKLYWCDVEEPDKHFLSVLDDGSVYCDKDLASWNIQKQADGLYTLSADGEHYLACEGSPCELTLATDATMANAHWQLRTEDDVWVSQRDALLPTLSQATSDQPIDATLLLPEANFDGLLSFEPWQGNPSRGGSVDNPCAEKYHNLSFDVWQELTDIPNGFYKVRAQGFMRDGEIDKAIERRQDGSEQLNACLYGNGVSTPLKSIFEEAGSMGDDGVETPWGRVPNDMDQASRYFSAGLYDNEIMVKVTDGTLRLGVRLTEGRANWTIFDNFRLTYYGQYQPGDANGDGVVTIADVTAVINHINGNVTGTFIEEAANVNGDETISIADVTGIINLINK